MLKKVCIAILITMSIARAPVYAENAFEITIQVYLEGGSEQNIYYSPQQNIIRVRGGGYAKPFKVVLKNITKDTQELQIDETTKGLGLITFDVTDENGNANVVTKKIDVPQSMHQGYRYVSPGKTKEFEVWLNERDWNNAFKLMRQGSVKLQARASYQNGSTVIRSEYYTIILE